MKVLNISGGATRASGLLAASRVVLDTVGTPDIISGVSAGAILALPLAIGVKRGELDDLTQTIRIDQIFKSPPIKPDGSFTLSGYVNLLSKKGGLSSMTPLYDRLKSIITKEIYSRYQESNTFPDVIISYVDLRYNVPVYKNVKTMLYEEYLDSVIASSSIPFFSQPIDGTCVDGGIYNHISSRFVLLNYTVSHCYSIYSRPERYDFKEWNPDGKTPISTLNRVLEMMLARISALDEEFERDYCTRNQIELKQIFLPSVLNSLYDTDPDKLKLLYQLSEKNAIKVLNNE